ncbi:carbohydrate ABC transporter membrane protein 2, CUT1 family (TC 3.A.1.1.-) [Marvinbryantia formatexigens]|nr:carbohydrate ABC transporter membrane protein 2, CUT1 family (TC 3.A.1.1.-) [Marvinbryantia formatexigens]
MIRKLRNKYKNTRKRSFWGQFFLVIILCIFSYLMLLPFIWAFSTSLRLPADSFDLPPSFFPTEWRWENYAYVFKALPFMRFFRNSIFVTVIISIVQILFSTMAAFAFAKLNFKGKNILFIYLLSGLMLPYQSYVIAQFFIMNKMHLYNTLWALILPYFANPFGIFLLRQNMSGIPDSYIDAATIDGASKFRIYWSIMLPMTKSSIVVVIFMKFIEQWNNFFAALIYINSEEHFTLPMGMKTLQGFRSAGNLAHILAGVMISLIVPTIVYAFGQKYLLQSTALSGLKS